MQKYETLVFDCDGVLLDSNRVKTEAFRTVAAQFGAEPAEALVAYHTQNGGISRYRKFEYLLANILQREASPALVDALATEYGNRVESDLLQCAVAPGLAELRKKTAGSAWLIVSGGDQAQLHRIFASRGLDHLFDGGIFGSPTSKDEILAREIGCGNIKPRALYLGDSRYDHLAASRAGLDFVFVHGWSEFAGWQEYSAGHGFPVVKDVAQVWPLLSSDAVAFPG